VKDCCVCASALLLFLVSRPESQSRTGFDLFRDVVGAAGVHQPGQRDAPVEKLAALDEAAHGDFLASLLAFGEFLREPGLETPRRPARSFSAAESKLLSQFAAAALRERTAATTLRQVALLYGDAAIVGVAPTAGGSAPARPPRPNTAYVNDGLATDVGRSGTFWRIGRAALDSLEALERRDPWSLTWYQAAGAHLFARGDLTGVSAHLDRARQLFADDPTLAFFEACLYQSYSMAWVQDTVSATRLPADVVFEIPNTAASLGRASRLLRDVLSRDDGFHEARVRFGDILLRQQRTADAAVELRRVAGSPQLQSDPVLEFWARLFLGRAERRVGNLEAARVAIDRAVALFPSAQSALIASMSLRPDSAPVLLPRFAPASAPNPAIDPWLLYRSGPGRTADARLRQLWTLSTR
jgi:tetratricopeptide (TPR) repeat protein